jgi:LPXTG-motif cell wall-anchored protein
MATTSATVPLLHRFLGIGLVMVAAVFVTLGYLGIAPLLPRTGVSPVIAYALSGIGVVLGAIALLLLKPRAPDRKPGQSVEQYWSTPETGARVLPVWFLLEVAGMTSAIGYLLTGEPVSLIVAALAIAAFWLCGPRVFDRA